MKPAQSFPAYVEFASLANETIVDLSDGYTPKGIPWLESERSPFDWLALHLYYVFLDTYYNNVEFYRRVLKELNTVKTENQIRELLDIEEKHAAIELVGYEDQWARLEVIKKALGDAIKKKA